MLRIVCSGGEILGYGNVNLSGTSGQLVHILADGSLASGSSYKKKSLSFNFQVMKEDYLNILLACSEQDFLYENIYFKITSDIAYLEKERFPGYYEVSFQGQEK